MNQISSRKLDPHLQLIGELYLVLEKIRKEGLLSVEEDVENPRESKLFGTLGDYDIANEPVYIFACDVLRLMVAGNMNAAEMGQYMFAYRRTTELNDEQQSMFEVARLTLLASLEGHRPSVSIEFGRHGIPAGIKPSSKELEDLIQAITDRSKESVEARLDKFFDSIGAPRA